MTIPFAIPDRKPYAWFKLCLWAGGALAVLLLANSVWYYNFIARRVLVDQVRRELTARAAGVDQEIQNAGTLELALKSEEQKSNGKIAWIEVRGVSGSSAAHEGMPAGRTFTFDQIRGQMQKRQAAFKTLNTAEGEVAVQAFPLRIPDGKGGWQPAMMEIALFVRGEESVLWPVRRNLILNCSAALALLLALSVMGYRLRSYIRGKQLEQQVDLARHVQQDLLATSMRLPAQFECAAESLVASHVSGDFYDAFATRDSGAAFVLGDVSGKGIPAALLMGVMQGAIHSNPWTESAEAHEESTRRINRLLYERASIERYSTLFWGYANPATGELHYINAGHCSPILVKANGSWTRLDGGGPVLGLLPDVKFRQHTVDIDPGDTLVLYSDGIVEATNALDEDFGEERVRRLVTDSLDSPVGEIRRRILDSVARFSNNAELSDDRTIMIVRYEGASRVEPVEPSAPTLTHV
jgi:hypothetical protein